MSEFRPLTLVNMGTVNPQTVSWLWKPYVPKGKLTLVMGDPEAGKSWLTLCLAAAVSQGGQMFQDAIPKGKVLLLSAEDGLADTIRPRLDMLGADPFNVICVPDTFELAEEGIERLRVAIGEVRPLLVIIDPIIAYAGQKMDTYRANHVRELMKRLKDLAEEFQVAMVMVIHMRKERNGNAMLGVQGSMDFIAASRSVLMVGREDGQEQEERTMAHAKCSVAKRGTSLSYTISDGRFEWLGESFASADDLSAPPADLELKGDKRNARDIVTTFLGDGEWHPSRDLILRGEEDGVSERTIKRVRSALGVEVEQRADGWWCRLPKMESKDV